MQFRVPSATGVRDLFSFIFPLYENGSPNRCTIISQKSHLLNIIEDGFAIIYLISFKKHATLYIYCVHNMDCLSHVGFSIDFI